MTYYDNIADKLELKLVVICAVHLRLKGDHQNGARCHTIQCTILCQGGIVHPLRVCLPCVVVPRAQVVDGVEGEVGVVGGPRGR